VSESAQIIVPETAANGLTSAAQAANGELDLPAPAVALADTEGIRAIAERVAAIARLAGQARVLLAGCRMGDGATTVAGALALDLSRRLGIETLLVEAGAGGAQGGGGALRVKSGGAGRLWTARCGAGPSNAEAARAGLPAGNGQAESDTLVAELQAVAARYRAAVIDLGVVRLDARMLALARPDDPVLIVARYGCTRRDELSSTAAILGLAKCRIGGVIFNAYESPASARIARLLGLGDGPPADLRGGATG
jgi:hypothetical protein